MNSDGDYAVYEIDVEGETRRYLSPLPHVIGFQFGLTTEAIIGELANDADEISVDSFKPNPVFKNFLQWVIGKHAISLPAFVAEAKRQCDGYVYVLDQRTPTPDGAVPPEDIIGGFEVKNGELIRFIGSPNYVVYGRNGLMSLERSIHGKLIDELTELAKNKPAGEE